MTSHMPCALGSDRQRILSPKPISNFGKHFKYGQVGHFGRGASLKADIGNLKTSRSIISGKPCLQVCAAHRTERHAYPTFNNTHTY